MGLPDPWVGQGEEWAAFALTPGYDHLALERPRFFELLPAPGRLTVEVGCSEGNPTTEFADRGHRVVAVDRWTRMAAIARRRPQLQTVAGADATRPPLRGHALADRRGGGCDSGRK